MNNENKNVWIITRRAGYNFGSSLQAYAMQAIIKKLKFNCEIIDYDEYRLRWKIRPFIHDLIFLGMRIFSPITKRIFSSPFIKFKKRDIQRSKFDLFDKNNYNLTAKSYSNSASIKKDMHNIYAVVCGSDQIWSPLLFDETMFLDFVQTKNIKKISYAPSFGVSKLNDNKKTYQTLLSSFDSLSIREDKGAEIIKDLTGKDVDVVLDPTLLLSRDDWDSLIDDKPIINEPYVLCYLLGHENIPKEFIDELSIKESVKIVCVSMYYNRVVISEDAIVLDDIGPSEFLNLIKNSSFVCTDSFHGSIFSIIYQKQFFCFERFEKDDSKNQNSRIYSLLINHALGDRLLGRNQKHETTMSLINYDLVNEKLKHSSMKSLQFLENSLS
jgi:hypothetical protein